MTDALKSAVVWLVQREIARDEADAELASAYDGKPVDVARASEGKTHLKALS